VAFRSYADNLVVGDTNNATDILLHDRQTGQITRVSVSSASVQGNSYSFSASISSDGRFVAFESAADNLVAGDTNGIGDIFVHDRQTVQTIRVSVSSTGVQGNSYSFSPSISSDGRFVAFQSYADNLVVGDTNGIGDIFVYDLLSLSTGQTLPFLPLLLIGD
jgi:Tol biopolymer transport system component